ncbi:MAG: UDP-N-acetylglucosamine--N-acetylmuramyl-(pentapeptide) pyrophosphoryl-undecaprenol N-acetylglucosamine transferase [Candidatus Campbellbacteria bacterium]|nr:UDP-N-acetylglucosamine--N-acetylmuramyl-(pentapeptide) pyrophosphoryl-undecaprenol N-acetylglucosamine transferase [Candidatus Campbellbacteria bacterium]
MRIILTGGGSGGHFYPMIAVAQQIHEIAKLDHLVEPELLYMAAEPYDMDALLENNIEFKHITAGKQRRYFSFKNAIDVFKIGWGMVKAVIKVFLSFPDVVFSKGGYPSVPVVFATKLFRIPLVIHESDTEPGRANAWAATYAQRIAISYPESVDYFEKITARRKRKPRIALTGNPVRHELQTVAVSGAHEFLKLEQGTPTILVLGGSQGAQAINETIIEALPRLIEKYQILHQTGSALYDITIGSADTILEGNPLKERYHAFPFLNVVAMRMSAGAADLIISRSGSGSIFEIAAWGKPSILIPIPTGVSHDQEKNAFAYARTGAGLVVEQANLTPNLLVSEIDRLMSAPDEMASMARKASEFARPDAAEKIAREVLDVALEHEK